MTRRARHEVITVLGPIPPGRMGISQTHEHLIMDAMDHYGGYEFVMDDEELAVEELAEFTRRGGGTICEVTLDEIGRNPRALARIARAAKVNVLMGCGWYREFGYPKIVEERTSRELADVLVNEIERGVGDTKVRAGFIGEIGTGRHFIKPAEERVFRAAALVKEGYGDRVLLSEDICMTKHLKFNGGKGYGYLLEVFVPMLRERGLKDADIHKLLVANPARAFARKIRHAS
jgi:predicted metal-dependent phosphotriesterase family hydrolase